MTRPRPTSIRLALAATIAACGGGEVRRAADTTQAPATPSAAAPATPRAGSPGPVALGDSIFHGQAAGGTCFTCHGQDGKGTQLAPDLTDQQWLNGDGSLQFMINTVTNGVPKPKQYPAPMLPMGGVTLTPEQVRAVATYEYSLSHPR
ncbi:MAG: c-type cytochrome [Gemmatimonadales bacterium]